MVDAAWRELPWFRWLRRQHALWTEFATALPGVLELSSTDRKRLAFALRQWADAVSPTNFLGSNPSALRRAFEPRSAEPALVVVTPGTRCSESATFLSGILPTSSAVM